jgi:hypothetical protein
MYLSQRAGINFLDGFGGGSLVESNALWNWVRETGDHGPFNSCELLRNHPMAIGYHHVTWGSLHLTGAPARYGMVGDRQAYLTDIRTGKPSLVPAQNNITRNLLFNSYSSTWPLDHVSSRPPSVMAQCLPLSDCIQLTDTQTLTLPQDDGSCYYTDTKNFMLYGGCASFLPLPFSSTSIPAER